MILPADICQIIKAYLGIVYIKYDNSHIVKQINTICSIGLRKNIIFIYDKNIIGLNDVADLLVDKSCPHYSADNSNHNSNKYYIVYILYRKNILSYEQTFNKIDTGFAIYVKKLIIKNIDSFERLKKEIKRINIIWERLEPQLLESILLKQIYETRNIKVCKYIFKHVIKYTDIQEDINVICFHLYCGAKIEKHHVNIILNNNILSNILNAQDYRKEILKHLNKYRCIKCKKQLLLSYNKKTCYICREKNKEQLLADKKIFC